MFNHFVNSLPMTTNHRLAAGHGFQVHASQALVAAGQHEYRAAPHGFGYFRPALPADELNLLPNAQFAHQSFKSGAIRPFSDDAALKLGKRSPEISERS